MEKKFIEAFAQVSMPEACAQKIEDRLERKKSGARYESVPVPESRFGWVAPVAAMLALVLALGLILPRMHQATNALAEVPTETPVSERQVQEGEVSEGQVRETQYSEEVLRAIEELENGLSYTEGRITYSYFGHPDGEDTEGSAFWDYNLYHTPFTDYIDGRVYFIANGENIDITDKFSPEEPFTYIYTDGKLITHYIAIGDTPENTGFFEITQMSWDNSYRGQIGGVGAKYWYRGEDDTWQCPWLLKARELFEPYGIYFVV